LLEPDQLDMLYEILILCPDHPDAFALRSQVEKAVRGRPPFDPHVTDAMEAAAERSRQQGDYGLALHLYRRVLARDRNRLCYLRAADCAEALGRRDSAATLLQELARATASEAVRQGALGRVAVYRGDTKRAIQGYQKSIEAAPDQEDVRRALFMLLIQHNRLPEARDQAAWFVQKMESGARHLRPELAEMWTALGDRSEALKFWRNLSQSYPASTYFTIEYARALYLAGQPEEAEQLLTVLLQKREDVRALTLLAEVHHAQARYEQTLEDTEKGLALEITRDLLRLRASAAEALGRPGIAHEAATALLNDDPGNSSMARLATRSLIELGRWPEARTFAEGLTNRNPANLSALLALGELAQREGRGRDAVRLAEMVTRQRPWDLEARRRLSAAWADQGQHAQALRALKGYVEAEPAPPIIALLYSDLISGPYPGRNTPAQVADHVERLAAEGYRFLTPDQLDVERPATEKSVLLFFADTDAQTLEQVDAVLATHHARATYALPAARDERSLAGQPTPEQAQALEKNGRWWVASAGLMPRPREMLDERNVPGKSLAQRLRNHQSGNLETDAEFQQRLHETVEDLTDPLPATNRVLVYPLGDYGQRALDSDARAMEALRRALVGSFQRAFATEESGHISVHADPLRLPLKSVPPRWSSDDLLAHLRIGNPAVNLQLQKAKVYYLDGRYSEARAWLAAASQSGAPALSGAAPVAPADTRADRITMDRLFQALTALEPAGRPGRDRVRPSLGQDQQPLVWMAGENDNRDRRYQRIGAGAGWAITDVLSAGAELEQTRWKRKGLRSVDGLRWGAGGRWDILPQVRLDGRIGRMDYDADALNDYWGGFLRIRVPQPIGVGELQLDATREEVGTVEAIQRAIEQWTYAIRSSTRLGDAADLALQGSYADRDDLNDTRNVDGRLLWQVRGTPYLGVGLYGQIADSWKNAADYYAPMELHQYQFAGEWRNTQGPLTYRASAQAGYARAQYRDWRFAWSARVLMEYAIWRQLYGFLEANYQDTVGYQRWLASGGVGARF
jgi:tetratricopeptide (TPR) repeat protein